MLELFLNFAWCCRFGSGSVLRWFTFFEEARDEYSGYGTRSMKARKIGAVANWQHCCTYDSVEELRVIGRRTGM
jgi:hypothetical protein